MKIRKTPSKKLAPVPSALRGLIKNLEECPEEEIQIYAEKIQDWTYPRGDLFHWTAVLNRFDGILQRICSDYDLQHLQNREFEASTKSLLIAIINISRILFENCTNRNIYNSYEYVNNLINAVDIDVLEAVLHFLLRPAQRVNNPRAIRSSFVAPQDKITELAHGWGIPVSFADMCTDNLIITDDMTTLVLRFYRIQSASEQGQSKDNESEGSDRTEGIENITIQLGLRKNEPDVAVIQELIKQHNIPPEYQFGLANGVRITKNFPDLESRKKLLKIRILAIAIMAHTVSETTAQNRVFVYEPHLVSNLAELLHFEKAVPYDIQVFSLCALDGIARHRAKLSEVLTALNASANHGILLQILRKTNQDGAHGYPRDFLEALFTLLSCLLQNQPGGQMLMSAGIIPALVQTLGNQNPAHVKYMPKVVSLLDTIVNAFTTSFSAFCNAGGLDTLLERIKVEVECCLRNTKSDESMEIVESSEQARETKTEDTHVWQYPLAPHDRVSAVKSMLKFLLRMMESTGTADALRNLIESSVPKSLLQIFSHPKVFGSGVFTLAINVMTTFIHSEPTSLTILQEAKLPQTFLDTICAYEYPSSEVLIASVNAFGAICLNAQGLDMFNEADPLPHFFELLASREYLFNVADIDCSTAIGSTMDELTRHHPSLRPSVFRCVTWMIKKVIEVGNTKEAKPSDNSHQLKVSHAAGGSPEDVEMVTSESSSKAESGDISDTNRKDHKSESLVVSYIDLVARFLEGLFQNQANIREFVKDGCPEILLEYYSLPYLPADFSITVASDQLAYIFKMISEVSTLPTIMAIADKAKESMKFLTEDDGLRTESMVHEYVDVKDNGSDKINRGNELFRKLIIMHGYVGLLSNICCSSGLAPGKNAMSLVTEFLSTSDDENIILSLGRLHRIMMWENFLLKESMPASWYSMKYTRKGTNTNSEHSLSAFGVDPEQNDASQVRNEQTAAPAASETSGNEEKPEKVPDADDPRMQNLKHFKLLLGDIPQFLMPVFQGLIKVSMSRRSMDSAQKAQMFKLAECITKLLKDNITWSSITHEKAPPCKYDYLATMYTMVSLMLMDERSQASLHTPLAVTFDRGGGIDLLLRQLDDIWDEASKLHALPKEKRSKEQPDILGRIDGCVEMLLTIFVYIGSAKLLYDSPYTAPVVVKNRKSSNFFDPYEWIVSVHLRLSTLRKYVESPDLSEYPRTVIHVLFDIIMEIIKGDIQHTPRTETISVFSAPLSSPFGLLRPPVVADARGVQTLVDMGFERSAAEHAMVRCNNQISRAVDYLFSHPTPVLVNAGGSNRGESSGQAQSSRRTVERSMTQDTSESQDQLSDIGENSGLSGSGHEETMEDEAESEDDVDDEESFSQSFGTDQESPRSDEQLSEGADEQGSSSKDKQKVEASSDVKKLQDARLLMKDKLPSIVLDLVEKREDVIFDVRDLLVAISKNKDSSQDQVIKDILSLLVERIDMSRSLPATSEQDAKTSSVLGTLLRLLALLFKEPSVQKAIPVIAPRLSFLYDMVDSASSDERDAALPSWLATVFLVLEAFLSQADEPKKVELMKFGERDDDRMSDLEDNDNEHMRANDSDTPKPDDPDPPVVSSEQRSRLLSCCVAFLRKTNISRDNIYAILRILVRLTKYHEAAMEFVERGGLPLLFSRPRSTLEGLQGQQAFIIMILRHIIENKAVLESSMEDLITAWSTIPRPRNMDIGTFIRNNAHIALREPSVFLDVASKLCRLTHYDEYDLNRQIKLVSKESESKDEAAAGRSTADAETSESHGDVVMGSAQPPQGTKTSASAIVINHLLQELISVRSEEASTKGSVSKQEKLDDDKAADIKKAENVRYAYTGFLLQCLVELVSSYNSCKHDVYIFGRRRNSKEGNSSRSRHSILNILLNDLLPYDAINPTAEESRKQQGLSMWAASMLVAMCYDAGPETEGKSASKDDLSQVRKYVLDGIIRSFKEAGSSTGPLSAKYGKYLALSDLCHRILNARPNAGVMAQRIKEDSVTEIAKIMIDKNFVGTLVSAVGDVDINYPYAKTVLNSMLRPLEQLTKISIKISDEMKGDDKKREEVQSFVPASTDAEVEEEAPDLYRHSALGMFDGSVMEEEEMDEFGSEDEDEETFDEEEFDEETGSDLSDMSEDGEEGDVDEEMDTMLHRHYDTDMEEDEGEEDEEGVESGDQSDIPEEEDDEDIGDEDDEGREMTWRLEDIEDEPVIQITGEVDVESADEEDNRRNRLENDFEEAQDEELETLDQSDFDEEEASENIDGEQGGEFSDDMFLDDEAADLIAHDLPSDDFVLQDDGRPRSLGQVTSRHFHRTGNRSRLLVEPVLGRSFRSRSGAGSNGTNNQDDIITHPLLTENQPSTNEGPALRGLPDLGPQFRSRSSNYNNWQAFEDVIGGSAMRLLETFLAHAPPNTQTGPLRVDVQGRTGGLMRTFEFDHLPFAPRTTGRAAETQGAENQNRELLSLLHDFQPMSSADRWQQEARMMYGNAVAEKAQKLVNPLLNILIPIAIEEERKMREEEERKLEQQRIEEEERRKAEEEKRRQVEEEERKRRAEEEERRATELAQQGEQAASTSGTETAATAAGEAFTTETPETAGSRTTVMINGEPIDISGTGIDIEFLEALPDDLREEVVSQHLRERRSSTQVTESESISPEFLDALPPDIREEVLQQESIERERRDRQRQGAGASVRDGTGLAAEDSTFHRLLTTEPGQGAAAGTSAAETATSRKPAVHRSAMQLVDRSQLATLARLLFVPQSISKSVLNKLLINLCENTKTRNDLLSFLVCVLHDGSEDLAAVDRSFTQLSLQSKGIFKPVSKSKSAAVAASNEVVPNLITQRCLEFLMNVVQWNEQSLIYFLTESDCLAGLKRTNSKKGKAKEKATPASKYPLLVLMSLLDRPVFIKNPPLMEELMHLIAAICRPLPLLCKKYVEKIENMQQQQQEDDKSNRQTGESGSNDDLEVSERREEEEDANDDGGKQRPGKSNQNKESERPVAKPPAIPDHYLKLVVHVLTSGECSSKTFQYTLSALSHLTALDNAQQVITSELMEAAKESTKQILHDLGELLDVLDNAMVGTEIQGSALSQFSAATSHQAKLLRVLKTIDYMYSRKPSTAQADGSAVNEETLKNEKRVLEIYEELNFLPLWKMLGQCLAVIHEKDDLINVATVLLPLIEAFMVVSKYAAEKGQAARSGSTGPSGQHAAQLSAAAELSEDFFFAFTEEHKKILNIMVRNNPSLMSGSFSLLVRNPKMLEFDNKRNYFVQQLHKRTGPREHYPPLQLNVRRQYVFEDSYHQLLGRTGDEIKYGKLSVRFYDEEGVDAGGVTREWFSVLARQMFDPNYALFITSAADKLTYQPNRASSVNPDHLSYLKFVGRVIGKAIYDGRLLDAYFTRSFYKHILGRPVDYRDVEAVDPEYYKSLVWMLENDITDVIDLTFSIETDDFGTTKVVDLKPGGRDIPVTEENKHEYVALVTEQKLTTAIKDQINAFLQGFHDIIPAQLIQIFNEQELELLISGLPDIDIDDWKNNTEYQGYSPSSPQIQWFWRAVRSFDQEERAKLLQFATGTSKVPLEGFAHLQGSGGVQRFQIHKDFGGENRLPSAHTCFNQIDLPEYDSYETLRANLFKAINECSTGFGFI